MFLFDGTALTHLVLLAMDYMAPANPFFTNMKEKNETLNRCRDVIKMIKVDPKNAIKAEKEVDLSSYHPNIVLKHIPNIKLDDVQTVLEIYKAWLTKEDRKKIKEEIHTCLSSESSDRILEITLSEDQSHNSKFRYGIVQTARYRQNVDLFIAIYKVEFKMKVEALRVKDLNEFKNLFKYKVLKRFETECATDEEKDRM